MVELGNSLDIWYFTATGIQRLSAWKLHTYYILVTFSFLYLLYRYRSQYYSKYIILMFFYGLMSYLGKDIQDYYKTALTILTIYWFIEADAIRVLNELPFLAISFILFSFSFFYTAYLNSDYLLITLSQYSRYLIVFLVFLILYKNRNLESFKSNLESMLFSILLIQISLSIAKYLIMGNVESIVGSINAQSGATATSLPILGFMFLWLRKNGLFAPKDWLFIIGLAFIGFVSLKRAIWFILPIVIFLFNFYIPKKKYR